MAKVLDKHLFKQENKKLMNLKVLFGCLTMSDPYLISHIIKIFLKKNINQNNMSHFNCNFLVDSIKIIPADKPLG
ncbi:hypothetical protein Phum_PHUM083010 [Pediculus humanus corporis]|uniref:Uncharacterized protein n=1 Tax=Pediculus humanus subsp. corporis TaxID=121224 RepID=E0VCC2_PEDHC|nr:uncharacterized protein Phum_PHUM083010 [Pediculus humanus corporis]EEB11008.1 hypothetical protein Phum_PHUM083010 [Pediculus humanus corporis]